jgi:hypothetical protein
LLSLSTLLKDSFQMAITYSALKSNHRCLLNVMQTKYKEIMLSVRQLIIIDVTYRKLNLTLRLTQVLCLFMTESTLIIAFYRVIT